jgi:hypothetical protein
MTSYGNSWLGDPAFAPVWDELNRRDEVVFVHPAIPTCIHCILYAEINNLQPASSLRHFRRFQLLRPRYFEFRRFSPENSATYGSAGLVCALPYRKWEKQC